MMTLSPSFTRNAGDTWADKLECLFSYLHSRRYHITGTQSSMMVSCLRGTLPWRIISISPYSKGGKSIANSVVSCMQPCVPIPFAYHYLHSQSFPTWEQQKILQLDVHPRPSPEHQHEMMVKLRTPLHMNSMTHVLFDNLTVFYRMPSLPSRSGGISTTCLIPRIDPWI
jgi:hypothetical protein